MKKNLLFIAISVLSMGYSYCQSSVNKYILDTTNKYKISKVIFHEIDTIRVIDTGIVVFAKDPDHGEYVTKIFILRQNKYIEKDAFYVKYVIYEN